jgi:hypothetical protein
MAAGGPDYTTNSHVVQKAYVGLWALKRRVMCHDVNTNVSELRHIKEVCVEQDFFAEIDDGGNHVSPMEQRLHRLETRGIAALRRLRVAERLLLEDRGLLAQYVGLHAVRGRAWRETAELMSASLRRRKVAETDWSHPEAARRFEEHAATSTFRHEVLVEQAIQVGVLLGSMHWTLLRFDEPALILSDHPVGLISDMGQRLIDMSVPPRGYTSTVELWWPVTPRLAIVGSWLDEPDDGPTVDSDPNLAARINTTIRRAARQQWLHRPGTAPAFDESGVPLPIAGELYVPKAFTPSMSRRGREAIAIVEWLIEQDQLPDEAPLVRVAR